MNGRDQIQRAPAETDSLVQMISFSIGHELFGVGILVIKEIIMMSEITVIPNSPDFVEGVINLRGSIIPILDLRKRLRLRMPEGDVTRRPGARILVVEIEGNTTGFIVDSVSKVITVPGARILPPPDLLVAGVQSQYVSGVVHLEDRILVVLDFRKILSPEEKGVLDEVSRIQADGPAGVAR